MEWIQIVYQVYANMLWSLTLIVAKERQTHVAPLDACTYSRITAVCVDEFHGWISRRISPPSNQVMPQGGDMQFPRLWRCENNSDSCDRDTMHPVV